jgi:hypothetical protein
LYARVERDHTEPPFGPELIDAPSATRDDVNAAPAKIINEPSNMRALVSAATSTSADASATPATPPPSQPDNQSARRQSSNHAACQPYAQSRTSPCKSCRFAAAHAHTHNILAQTCTNPTVYCMGNPLIWGESFCATGQSPDCASRKNAGLELNAAVVRRLRCASQPSTTGRLRG